MRNFFALPFQLIGSITLFVGIMVCYLAAFIKGEGQAEKMDVMLDAATAAGKRFVEDKEII